MSQEALTKAIADIREGLRDGRYSDVESRTRGILLRLLGHLGWDVFDTAAVRSRCSFGGRTADYALVGADGTPAVFIDAGGPRPRRPEARRRPHAISQPVAIWTVVNGPEWAFHLAATDEDDLSECFRRVELLSMPPGDIAHSLSRFLSYEDVRNGDAVRTARAALDLIESQRRVREAFPTAWTSVRQMPQFLDLMQSEVEMICGVRPSAEATARYFHEFRHPSGTESRRGESPKTGPVADSGRNWFELLERRTVCSTQIQVVRQLLVALQRRDATFFHRFADRQVQGRRHLIARDREALYPQAPRLAKRSVALADGWWLATHYNRSQKLDWLRLACEVAGIRWNHEVIVNLPKASVSGESKIGSPTGSGKYALTLDGNTRHFNTGVELLKTALTELRRRDDALFEHLSLMYRGRKRRPLATNRADVYPGQPKLQSQVHRLPGGWFVGTNTGSDHKVDMIRRACRLVGVEFGRELIVVTPNGLEGQTR